MGGFTERPISPNGRLINSWDNGIVIYDLDGRVIVSKPGLAVFTTLGWLPDSSGVVFGTGSLVGSGNASWAILNLDGTVVTPRLPFAESPAIVSVDGRWLAAEGPPVCCAYPATSIRIASRDGTISRVIADPGERAYPVGWLPDGSLLYAVKEESVLHRATLDGSTTTIPGPAGFSLTPIASRSPDGSALLFDLAGTAGETAQAAIYTRGAWLPIAFDTWYGWSGPHEFVARRGGAIILIDASNGAVRSSVSAPADVPAAALLWSTFGVAPFVNTIGASGHILYWKNTGAPLVAIDLDSGKTARSSALAEYSRPLGPAGDGHAVLTDATGLVLVDLRAFLASP